MHQMAGQLGIFSPMTIQFGAYGAYSHAVSLSPAGEETVSFKTENKNCYDLRLNSLSLPLGRRHSRGTTPSVTHTIKWLLESKFTEFTEKYCIAFYSVSFYPFVCTAELLIIYAQYFTVWLLYSWKHSFNVHFPLPSFLTWSMKSNCQPRPCLFNSNTLPHMPLHLNIGACNYLKSLHLSTHVPFPTCSTPSFFF